MATLGGNVLQRTRCTYFRDPGWANATSATPARGCAAMNGFNRKHAVLGVSDQCIATYPGDFAQALIALDAIVRRRSGLTARERMRPSALHRPPGEHAGHRDELAARRADHGLRHSRRPWTRRSRLREGPRPRVLRVRARLGGGGARLARRIRRDGAHRARRRRDHPMARARGGGRAARPRSARPLRRQRSRGRRLRQARSRATTIASRSRSASGRWCGRSSRPRRWRFDDAGVQIGPASEHRRTASRGSTGASRSRARRAMPPTCPSPIRPSRCLVTSADRQGRHHGDRPRRRARRARRARYPHLRERGRRHSSQANSSRRAAFGTHDRAAGVGPKI